MAFIMNVKILKSLMFKRYDDWNFILLLLTLVIGKISMVLKVGLT